MYYIKLVLRIPQLSYSETFTTYSAFSHSSRLSNTIHQIITLKCSNYRSLYKNKINPKTIINIHNLFTIIIIKYSHRTKHFLSQYEKLILKEDV